VDDLSLGPKPPFLRDIAVSDLLDAKIQTSALLASLGETENYDAEIEKDAARSVFQTITNPSSPEDEKRSALALIDTPEAVQHIHALLTAYDMEFVSRASQIRNFVMYQLLDDCDHPDPKVRLKALELTGKVAEIGLFEEKISVKRKDLSDEELDAKIKARMERLKALERPADAPIDVLFEEKTA
jgi:hypothetical protein